MTTGVVKWKAVYVCWDNIIKACEILKLKLENIHFRIYNQRSFLLQEIRKNTCEGSKLWKGNNFKQTIITCWTQIALTNLFSSFEFKYIFAANYWEDKSQAVPIRHRKFNRSQNKQKNSSFEKVRLMFLKLSNSKE